MNIADNITDNILTDKPAPGRPKGQPKTGGRPKGARNKVTREIRELACKYTDKSVKLAWQIAKAAKEDAVRLKAIELILAYGHGKPTQRQEISGPDGAAQKIEYSPTELARRMLSVMDLAVSEIAEAAEATPGAGLRESVRAGADMPSEKNPPEKKSKAPEIKNPEYSPGDEVEVNGLVFRCEGPKSWTCLEDGRVIRRFPEHKIEWLEEWAGGRNGAG